MHLPLRIPTHRRPTTPGEMLVEEFLRPMGMTQSAFAQRIGVTYPRLNEIARGKRAVSVETALRLARALGTSPEWWMRMQLAVDLYDATHGKSAKEIARIRPIAKKAS